MRLAEVCYARKGVGFWANHDYDLRTRESQRALIGQAWAQHPHSEMARATKLRPYGLHPAPNPCHDVVGLDVYQGCALPLMHITYHMDCHPRWVPKVGWRKVDHFVFASPKFFFNPEVATF